jgi:2-methylisocitrate lyase-like PEP mutase family enzyme
MFLVLPDLGFVGLKENAKTAAQVPAPVELSLIVDADTGFGDALKLLHAGACALRLEDEVMPKKSVGTPQEKRGVATNKMVGKIRAAVGTHDDGNFQIIALSTVQQRQRRQNAGVRRYATS